MKNNNKTFFCKYVSNKTTKEIIDPNCCCYFALFFFFRISVFTKKVNRDQMSNTVNTDNKVIG